MWRNSIQSGTLPEAVLCRGRRLGAHSFVHDLVSFHFLALYSGVTSTSSRLAMTLFLRQFAALVHKNGIVLTRHWAVRSILLPFVIPYLRGNNNSNIFLFQLNLLRCFLIPVAFGIFVATAQTFLTRPNNVSNFILCQGPQSLSRAIGNGLVIPS